MTATALARVNGRGLQLHLPGVVTATSLELPEGLTYEEWTAVGTTLDRMGGSWQWWYGDWYRYGEHRYGEAHTHALSERDYDTLNAAQWVAGRIENVRRRTSLSWSHHKEVAALEPDEQDEWLDRAVAGDGEKPWTRDQLRWELRKAKRGDRHLVVAGALPDGQFDVVYADPPWRYDFAETPALRDIDENHYGTQSLEDICALPVSECASEASTLFLWATAPKLEDAFAVVQAWGFRYRTNLVWVKDRVGMGYYVRNQHELLLIARRGDAPLPMDSEHISSVLDARRGTHSAKPEAVRALIERMYPHGRYLELYARGALPAGWTGWGNEADA